MKEIKATIRTLQFKRNKKEYLVDIITTEDVREAWLYRDGYHKHFMFGEPTKTFPEDYSLIEYVKEHLLKDNIEDYEEEIEALENMYARKFYR